MWRRMKRALCLAVTGCMLVSALPGAALAASPFSDVPAGSWYATAVNYVYRNNLMGAVNGNAFGPEEKASRGQIVTILYRLEGQPKVSGSSSFRDVSADYYRDAVIWAEKNGIVSGADDGRFHPNQKVTREQMAAFFYRYAYYKKYDITQKANTVYADQWQISTYALNAMRWAVGTGLISGTDGNMLSPKAETSRAQLATALMRFADCYQVDLPQETASLAAAAGGTAQTSATSATLSETVSAEPTVVEAPAYQFRWPVQGSVSSGFGSRYIFGSISFHRGLDIPVAEGTSVRAGQTGTVSFVGDSGSYGNLVILDHGNGFQSYYGHNSQILVKKGDVVVQGQTIAAAGATGRATGPHCHFEVRYQGQLVDPMKHLPAQNNAPANEMVVTAGG